MDKRQLIAAIVEKTGVKLDEDDPAFLLVDLNLMVLESRTGEAATHLASTTKEFNQVVTRSVDDFVAVANEALSKFMLRTSEIKTLLEKLGPVSIATPAVAAAVPPVSSTAAAPIPAAAQTLLWWLGPLIFSTGLVTGVALSILLGR